MLQLCLPFCSESPSRQIKVASSKRCPTRRGSFTTTPRFDVFASSRSVSVVADSRNSGRIGIHSGADNSRLHLSASAYEQAFRV